MKFYKLMVTLACVLWASVIFHIIALEAVGFKASDLLVSGTITIILLVLYYIYYFYLYFKNAKKVKKLKQEYLDSLKPTKRLLFCPTDEELVKKYNETPKAMFYKEKQELEKMQEDTTEEEMSM